MLNPLQKRRLIEFLYEDIAGGDITAKVMPEEKANAVLVAKEACVVSGLEEAGFIAKSRGLKFRAVRKDGDKVKKQEKIAELFGSNRKMVSAERTILNVMGRMSGVATICHKAAQIAGGRTRIFLTRKTMPGLNEFDKKACLHGGVFPHRKNLNEMILLKPNHLAFFGSIGEAVEKANKGKRKGKVKKAEVETKNPSQAAEAAEAGVDWIMLDNFSASEAKEAITAVRSIAPKAIIECSGGINLRNLRQYVTLGADIISMGELTKKAGMVDFSLRLKRGS